MAQRRAVTPEQNDAQSVCGLVIMGGTLAALVTIVAASTLTRHAVHNWDRYTLSFAAIECTPPPGQKTLEFLAEVQYLAGMPDRLSLLDDHLASRLADAFACHPLVEKVGKVVIQPTRQVHVQIDFRAPPKRDELASW
jgi:hypothetical protein